MKWRAFFIILNNFFWRWESYYNPFIHNDEKWSNILQNSCGMKYVWPFFTLCMEVLSRQDTFFVSHIVWEKVFWSRNSLTLLSKRSLQLVFNKTNAIRANSYKTLWTYLFPEREKKGKEKCRLSYSSNKSPGTCLHWKELSHSGKANVNTWITL